MAKRYRVTLTTAERAELGALISRGKADARKLAHARVLLQADEAGGPARPDRQIAAGLDVSTRTVERVRQRFVEGGLEAALSPRPPRRLYLRKLGRGGRGALGRPDLLGAAGRARTVDAAAAGRADGGVGARGCAAARGGA
jgi:hypothetical protein